MRGTFQAFDARLKVGDGVFERPHATVDTHVGELDHGLRFGKAAAYLVADVGSLPIKLLVDTSNGFGDETDLLPGPFGHHFEVTTGFVCCNPT